jgi:hypothetical protein
MAILPLVLCQLVVLPVVTGCNGHEEAREGGCQCAWGYGELNNQQFLLLVVVSYCLVGMNITHMRMCQEEKLLLFTSIQSL